MSENDLFLKTKKFIEEKPASAEAIKELSAKSEISIILESRIECAYFFQDGPRLEQRKAKNPEVAIYVNSEAVRRLETISGDNMAETSVEILREVVAGNIKLSIVGSVTGLINHGYLKIITKAGPDFFAFLSQHGMTHLFKAMAYLRNIKK